MITRRAVLKGAGAAVLASAAAAVLIREEPWMTALGYDEVAQMPIISHRDKPLNWPEMIKVYDNAHPRAVFATAYLTDNNAWFLKC